MDDSLYLSRYAHPIAYFDVEKKESPHIVIVIPCFKEDSICKTLTSFSSCSIAKNCKVEVLVLINHPESASEEVKRISENSYREVKAWISCQPETNIGFQVRLVGLPAKKAGVGLARKIAMDDALRLFQSNDHQRGIIVNLDADCTVAPNYLEALYAFYLKYPDNHGASIYFEHALPASNHPLYAGIVQYELFLRYYVQGLRFAGYPHAFHTIGSSMVVRADIYEKSGGMNTKKAGEDFYFIHKIIPFGSYTDLNTTAVYPAARSSDRVPFGTGAALSKYLSGVQNLSVTYDPKIFIALKLFLLEMEKAIVENRPPIFEDKLICEFLIAEGFEGKWSTFRQASGSTQTLRQKFFHWFDGLKVLKFVHFATDKFHPKVDLTQAVSWLLAKSAVSNPSLYEMLLKMRQLDRKSVITEAEN